MAQLSLNFSDTTRALLSPEEIYVHLDQALLRELKEDRRIEFKSAGVDGRSLGEYYSMWANTTPSGGLIAIGVESDGQVSGCSRLSQSELNELEQVAPKYCPDARFESRRVAVVTSAGEPDFILLVRVSYREDKVVKTVSGRAFKRIGDQKRALGEDEIRELQIDRGELDLERETVTDLSWPADFDSILVTSFCQSVRQHWQLDGNQSNEEILQHRRLGRLHNGSFVPNTACVLVFAVDPLLKFPGCQIRFLRYEGESEKTGEDYNVIKDIQVEGPIPRLLERAAAVLESQLRDFSALGKNGKFYTVTEYPRSAWYEALVNACVHRSYGLRNRPVFVKMFDDRLVVESP